MKYLSYEKYFIEQLNLIHPKLSVYPYKRKLDEIISKEDFLVVVSYDSPNGKVELFQFAVSRGMWRNYPKNKQEYTWMRKYADPKINLIRQ